MSAPKHLTDEDIRHRLDALLGLANVPATYFGPGVPLVHIIENLYLKLQSVPGKLDNYGKAFANDWEALWPHVSARLNEGPDYVLSARMLDSMKRIRDHKE